MAPADNWSEVVCSAPVFCPVYPMSDLVKVHLGSGPNLMPGWVNVDYNADFQPQLVADLTEPFPFDSDTVDYIHSEGCLCQFDFATGQHFLRECLRILKPAGVMRLLTPDLTRLLCQYLDSPRELLELWHREVPIELGIATAGAVVNVGIRDLHRFMYDAQTLERALEEIGFTAYTVGYNQSQFEPLQGIDVRAPDQATYMYYECCKPK